MKSVFSDKLERARFQHRYYARTRRGEKDGFFRIRGPCRATLVMMVSNGMGWEHVSVSLKSQKRVPNWQEMCFVKDLFWDEGEVVVQYHPRKSEYVNNHEFVLHLWRPIDVNLPTPPAVMVGVPGVSAGQARLLVERGVAP